MILRRLVVAALCCALSAPSDVSALRLRGVKESKLERRDLQSKVDLYTWNSGDQSVVASVSKSKHDAMMEKLKSSKGTTSADSNNRPPQASDGSAKKGSGAAKSAKGSGGSPKGSGPSYDGGSGDQPDPKSSSGDNKSPPERPPPKGSNPSYDGGSGDQSAPKSSPGSNKSSPDRPTPKGSNPSYDGGSGDQPAPKSSPGSTKSSPNRPPKGSNPSYDGGSDDRPAGKRSRSSKKSKTNKKTKTSNNKGGKKGSGASKSSGGGSGTSTDNTASKASKSETSSIDDGSNNGSGSIPVTPPRPPLGQDEALTGVAVSRFALLYSIDHAEGMPMTNDYEAVHENTYMWLYTIMFREFGDQMKNLLTDDTSNIYEANQPVTIEYASVVLFSQDDRNIPTQEELDVIVMSAFTGDNGETYLDGIQSLPRSNPFRSTSAVELESVIPGEGRSVMGRIADRVSSKGMAGPLIGAAALMVFLAGGATLYKARKNGDEGGKGGKLFDSNTLSDETQTMTDEFTHAMKTVSIETGQAQGRGEWENIATTQPISEETRDPDLDGLMEDDSQNLSIEDKSQFSIEDFVNEAERNLLGARIRYPTEGQQSSLNGTDAAQSDVVETSTALVTAPPSAIVPASEISSRTTL